MDTLDDVRADKARRMVTFDRKAYNKALYLRKKSAVMSYYSKGPPACACCGETEIRFLGIDHIKPVGQKRDRTGNIYQNLKSKGFPPGFQVLCHNCNMAKGALPRCPVHNSD